MSHSTVTIVLPTEPQDEGDLNEQLRELLAPFDENIVMDPYRDYVERCPDGWQATIEHRARFRALQESGIERREAWKMVWGDSNDDPQIPWPRSVAIDDGIDPNDDRAVAACYNGKYDDSEDRYDVDDTGLYSMSTYNPKSRWDWWSLGGRWTGFYLAKNDMQGRAWVGSPGLMTEHARSGQYDCISRGDVNTERMMLVHLDDYRQQWHKLQDPTNKEPVFYGGLARPDETLEEYVERRLTEYRKPWYTFAILAEGVWKEPGRMGWWGVDSSTSDTKGDFHRFFDVFWDGMPEQTYVACVDVHI